MAGYPLQPLLRARKYREDAAASDRIRAQRLLEEEEAREAEARETLRGYRDWRPEEEERLFQKVRGKTLSQAELAGHRQEVRNLRQAENTLEEALRQASTAVSARRAEVEEAKGRHAAAVRDRKKIETHRDLWRRQETRRREAAEEAELEEFRVFSVAHEE